MHQIPTKARRYLQGSTEGFLGSFGLFKSFYLLYRKCFRFVFKFQLCVPNILRKLNGLACYLKSHIFSYTRLEDIPDLYKWSRKLEEILEMLRISFDLCACVSSINKFFINSVQQTTGDVFSLVLISYPDNLWFVAS